MRIVVTSAKTDDVRKLVVDDVEITDVLGDVDTAIGCQLQEVVSSVSQAVSEAITEDAELTVEIAGSVTLRGEGGAKFWVFNVGGGAETSDTMKVTVKTTVKAAGK